MPARWRGRATASRRSTPLTIWSKRAWRCRERSTATIRGRIEALRGSEEQAVLTPGAARCDRRLARCRGGVGRAWPLDPFDFGSIAAQLTEGYRERAPPHSRPTGRRRAPTICMRCASASSISLPDGA